MNKIEKLEQIATGLETKLQMKKSELEKVKLILILIFNMLMLHLVIPLF